MNPEIRIEVTHDVDVLKARRICREMVESLGFDNKARAAIETSVSELATNLVAHGAKRGEIILTVLEGEKGAAVEVRSEDAGPGILNMESAMTGGNSTTGTLGIGLSGVRRLMDDFLIESAPGRGTRIVARKWLPGVVESRMDFSVLAKPKLGEQVSGDAYYMKRFPSGVLLSVIDALGHGPEANRVALKTMELLDANCHEPLSTIIERCHKGLHMTRGAAMAVCRIHCNENRIEHIGIGNVETRIYGVPVPSRPFCFNGTLGMSMENIKVLEYPYIEGCTIVMYSDGIEGRFDLDQEQLKKSPLAIATYIFNNYSRGYDDVTVLVGR